ncbi:uncharacterized protein LOC113959621 [Corapipo altera]|uniref:uncharacterized protein LOC113959621 n=1 Tax=Corapipo altera TaxID=415028 RepID=UPI000FD68003|nr:uncharacterized protein LOC113959621 [Corapipo altera]
MGEKLKTKSNRPERSKSLLRRARWRRGGKGERKSAAAAFSKKPERAFLLAVASKKRREPGRKIAVIHRGQIGGRKWEFAACPVPGVGSVGSGSPGPGWWRGPDASGSSIPAPRRELPEEPPAKGKQPAEAGTRSTGNFSPAFLRSHPSGSCPWLSLRDTSCAGLSPAEGCEAQTPLGCLERGRAHPLVGALAEKASPNLLPPSLVFWGSPLKDSHGGLGMQGQREQGMQSWERGRMGLEP